MFLFEVVSEIYNNGIHTKFDYDSIGSLKILQQKRGNDKIYNTQTTL